MSISADLAEDNPWWRDPNSIKHDIKIKELDNLPARWHPSIIYTFDSTDLLYSLRGPRQVGKTTLVKLKIKELLEGGTAPHNIMYYALDVVTTPKDLVNIVKEYLDGTKRLRKNNRCYIFLDEVSTVRDWQRGLKRLWDQDRLTNCTVVVTGSNTMDIKTSTEKLPGRRGITNSVLDKIMIPMKFSEFVAAIDPDIKDMMKRYHLPDNHVRHNLLKRVLDMDLYLDDIGSYVPALNRHLKDYLLTGGTPKVVNEYVGTGVIQEGTYDMYLDAILGDLQSMNKSRNTFMQLARNIIKVTGSTASWGSLQKYTDIGSQDTVSSYVDTLQSMFLLSIFYQYNTESGRAMFRSAKKIYLHDPFYLHVLNGWVGGNVQSFDTAIRYVGNDTNLGRLVEGVVANHLIRLAFNVSSRRQNFEYSDVLFHWRYGKDREVDFVYDDQAGIKTPIEVKFQNHITARDLDGLINFKRRTTHQNAILLSKDTLDIERECIAIPVSLFLLLV